MIRTLLIIDDNNNDRTELKNQLFANYNILEAVHINEAFSMLESNYKLISAIIMDIVVDNNSGAEVLKNVRSNSKYLSIPVIIYTNVNDITQKEMSLELGANGFLLKQCRKSLLNSCINNVVNMRENAALNNLFSRDKLTGMLTRDVYFDECDKYIKDHEPGYYLMSCVDIDNFKVLNDQYGMSTGDEILKYIGKCISKCVEKIGGIACRFTADRFAVLYPVKYANSEIIFNNHKLVKYPDCINRTIKFRIGRYVVNDFSISANIMYERATVAEESIKGRYDIYIAEYNDSMRNNLLKEQKIVNEMESALASAQFHVFLQPQYNHSSGALIGAEALARWKKDDSFVSPSEFIPIFERNGFIYELDKYIWEQSCILIRKWIDSKKSVLPISVNISRSDLYRDDFFDVISGLIKKYEIPSDYLRLEVTESAFADSPKHIIDMVNKLIDNGFTVEIDDFGSGYSSLNTLKDVKASILKLDMKFFEDTDNLQRSGNIIESVVRMAKWLGMAVIAEGVEEKSQADFLKSIGCYYIQGYYYAKPMPVKDYETLLSDNDLETRLTRLKSPVSFDNNDFWNPKSMETLIFNSYVGGACIFEYVDGKTELLRVNEQYAHELGRLMPENPILSNMSLKNYLDKDNYQILNKAIITAIKTQKESVCELELSDIENNNNFIEYIRYTLRVIATTGERYLFYCVMVNMTEQRTAEHKRLAAEHKEMESTQLLQIVMKNINSGISAIIMDEDGRIKLLFYNERYFELYGYTRKQAIDEHLDIIKLIIPEDFEVVMKKIKQLKIDRKPVIIDFRCKKRNGDIAYLRANSSLMGIDGYGDDVITSVVTNITSEQK